MKRSLRGKAALTVTLLVTGILPLLASPTPLPEPAALASLTSPLDQASEGALATTRTVIPARSERRSQVSVGADHKARRVVHQTSATPVLLPTSTPLPRLGRTPSGLVSATVQASIKHCYNTTRNVWLTFDDGYTSQPNLSSILATLRASDVRARFFLVGSWARLHPAMVAQIVAAGHFVENHTNTHAHLNLVSDAAVHDEIAYGQASNTSPKLLRPPYGDGEFTVRLYNLAQQQGYRLCSWDTDTQDWAGASAATIVNRVVNGDGLTPPARAGDTVLMHLKDTQVRYALPTMIAALRAKGLTFDKLR